MKKLFSVFFSFFVFNFLFAVKTYAVCPVCTVAVAAGLGLSRYLGIDDTVSGVWIGGLTLSTSLWFISWLENKWHLKTKFKYTEIITLILMFALVYIPLISLNIIGHPFNVIFGIDKLLFGGIFGVIAFLLGMYADKRVREIKGKQLFSFQKVVFPVSFLAIISVVFYLITR